MNVHGRGNDECVWGETKATENGCKERALLHEHVRHTNNVSVSGKSVKKYIFVRVLEPILLIILSNLIGCSNFSTNLNA